MLLPAAAGVLYRCGNGRSGAVVKNYDRQQQQQASARRAAEQREKQAQQQAEELRENRPLSRNG